MTATKFEIREKEYKYMSQGSWFTGIKFSVWNSRTNRKLGQHRTRRQAQAQIDGILEIKDQKRFARKKI